MGKSTLIKCMVKHFTQQNLAEVLGPITVVAGVIFMRVNGSDLKHSWHLPSSK